MIRIKLHYNCSPIFIKKKPNKTNPLIFLSLRLELVEVGEFCPGRWIVLRKHDKNCNASPQQISYSSNKFDAYDAAVCCEDVSKRW